MRGDPHFDYWVDKKDGTAVIAEDRYLEPHQDALRYRYNKFVELKNAIEQAEGGLEKFSRGYEKFGVQIEEGGIRYTEWAPGAKEMYLFGEFSGWDRYKYPMERGDFGVWSLFIPNKEDGSCPIPHASKIKVCVVSQGGMHLDRNPAWSSFCVQNPESFLYDAQFWNPEPKWTYSWQHADHLPRPDCLRIYECHIGMGGVEPRVNTYQEFTDNILPRIKKLGYTAIQIMAIMEHSYYASFGYHVTNFFACSSRCGTPEDLKRLIDTAHNLGLQVLMDVVHSHASCNSMDGINQFDGTDHQYFHEGEMGRHSLWDSRLFNYGHWEVIRFLLSNLRWWCEEYHFDGFRFDGVTSMLYKHHGIGFGFTGNYDEYFGYHVDIDACVYIMLANSMLHELYPDNMITVGEDVSGMPTLCRPVEEGGLGFDYRLAMAIPDKWIELLEKVPDEMWDPKNIVHTLTNRRWNEKTIAYAESHDQALVGDKTIAFWLMDAEMYNNMTTKVFPSPTIERGIALHKIIRLLSYALGGEGYLTFMGNEFGHPEWVDFPRAGNGWSYQHARRRFDLADNEELRYKFLQLWEQQMHECETKFPFCRDRTHQYVVLSDIGDKVIAFEKGERLLFVFNMHPTQSYTDYRIGTMWAGKYKIVLDSDAGNVDGQGRVHWDVIHQSTPDEWMGRPNYLQFYLPARTCQVYHCFELEGAEAEAALHETAPESTAEELSATKDSVEAEASKLKGLKISGKKEEILQVANGGKK
eukprot:CAMPEP_0198364708 /NCGR_PEP_ID=MMETSP1450-20131203/153802_1 /TAXON_ID=753684 ORGANISM="Madagascaria erythrocladiodes, Strain CCMP3234" /NCGR_SAMPLE_ID=MMETSP1450 /ASSEMBLY_ACC=CAM_ASM_001115 /LENGTH=749 /DNA_ID=CAMNT_0044072147 /DNA_START=58 /DNA_END=2307 /DNA_ORIENTATION=+